MNISLLRSAQITQPAISEEAGDNKSGEELFDSVVKKQMVKRGVGLNSSGRMRLRA